MLHGGNIIKKAQVAYLFMRQRGRHSQSLRLPRATRANGEHGHWHCVVVASATATATATASSSADSLSTGAGRSGGIGIAEPRQQAAAAANEKTAKRGLDARGGDVHGADWEEPSIPVQGLRVTRDTDSKMKEMMQ
jgi:hypothetical protein